MYLSKNNECKIFLNAINNNTNITNEETIYFRSLSNPIKVNKKNDETTIVEKVSKTFYIKLDEIKRTFLYFGIVELPSKNFIIDFFNELTRVYNNTNETKYAFISFKFKNFWLSKVYVYSNEYDTIINKLVEEILDNNQKYGDQENRCEGVVLSYKVIEYQSIYRWFSKPVNSIIKFKDFSLFTASDISKNCVQQCVEYLNIKYDKYKSFEDNVFPLKVVSYIPIHNSMELVTLINDLMTNADNINNTDCTNIVRVIKLNGHMGIITKINIKRKFKIQHKTPIKVDNTYYKNIFVDIESFTDSNGFQKPYLICWADNENVEHRVGLDCINKFSNMIKNCKENIIIYAWFGSGYDFQYILVSLMKYFKKFRYIIKNNMIVYAEFTTKSKTIILKDPYLFLLCSLDKASKAFNVTTKGSFPHQIIKEFNDIYKIPEKWPTYTQKIKEIIEEFSYNVKIEQIATYVPNNERIIDKAIDYCKIDVIAMKETWTRFNHLLYTTLNVKINPRTFTLSQLSMSLMESKLSETVKLHVPNRENYEFIKKAIYGGRVIAKNGVYKEPILYADVVSLYPSAMRLLEHAHGIPKRVKTRDINKHGVYKVRLKHKSDSQPENYLEFVARRIDNKLKWNWFKEHVGYYHTYDLLIAEGEGFEIEIIDGIEYEYKGYIFNDYIDTLYKLKEDHSSCDCNEQPCPIRMIAKIALNGGGYGKFVQKPVDKEVYIVDKDIVAGECENLIENEIGQILVGTELINKPKFYELDCDKYDKMVIERNGKVNYSTQCGVSILSGSRYRLWELCKKLGTPKIIYSDTDSIYVLESSINKEEFYKFCGKELGQLDNELGSPINKMIIGGPKMYGYEYGNNVKLYCKGVPKRMLTLNQFEYMLEDKSNNLVYEFDILRRKLVGIEELRLLKEIKQT